MLCVCRGFRVERPDSRVDVFPSHTSCLRLCVVYSCRVLHACIMTAMHFEMRFKHGHVLVFKKCSRVEFSETRKTSSRVMSTYNSYVTVYAT